MGDLGYQLKPAGQVDVSSGVEICVMGDLGYM